MLNSADATSPCGFSAPDAASSVGQKGQAESAAAGKSFPASLYGGLSADAIVSLQSDPSHAGPQAPAEAAPSTEEAFLKEARKNPLERMIEQWRKQALDSMGLSENDLKGMDANKLAGIEKKVAQFIEQRLKEALGTDNATASRDGGATGGGDSEGAGALMVKFS
ncbi:MAG: hypothetical protein ABI740_11175 [Alphaproteobacteria bacterium]